MKKTILLTSVAVITLGIISESWAAWSDNCPSGTTAGSTCKQCGLDCAYTQNGGAVTLYGSGEVAPFQNINGKYYIKGTTTLHPFIMNTNITSLSFASDSAFTSIGEAAFHSMTNVSGNLTLPNTLTSIEKAAFYGMTNITGTLTIPDSVTSLGSQAFDGTGLTSVIIPSSVVSISSHPFRDMANLNELVIPDSWGDDGFDFSGFNKRIFTETCFNSLTRPNTTSSCMNAKIVCQGDKIKCQTALTKFLPGGEFCEESSNTCISSDSIISVAEAVANGGDVGKLCNSGMYEWDTATSTCKRLDSSACNQTTKYYYNTTNNQCQVLPKTQSACTGTDIEWDTNNSKCINKNAITAPAGDPVTPVEETPQQVTAASCAADGKVLQGKECVSSCGASFRLNDGECDRIRYTPAEAAAILNDDDNTITITFKK